MLHLNPSQRTLITLLSDGLCHSGNELGLALGVSRSAIWKYMNQLIELGLPVFRIPHQGYILKRPCILLNEESISHQLKLKQFEKDYKIHLLTTIDSTNSYLSNLPFNSSLDICCAELQTQGRGRFGRLWHSPFGENIYCSARWTLNCDISKLSGLSLVTSLAVAATLKEYLPSESIQIKWPNDILWHAKKLCGILIEIHAESHANAQVIIGIGLNINTDTFNQPLSEKPWCSLYEITGQFYDRNLVLASLLYHLERYLSQFLVYDLAAFIEEWKPYDYLYGQNIQVTQALKTISGTALGIDTAGHLILRDEQGIKHVLSSGDTSLNNRFAGN